MTEEQIAKLEGRVSRLESRPKSAWDVVQIVGGLLLPAAIAYVGHTYAKSEQATRLALEARQADREHEVAQVNARVSQGGLVASMIDALISSDPKRRKLASEAVLIALPDGGPALVRLVSESDTSQEVRRFATSALARRRAVLVAGLFADTPGQRGDAYNALIAGWPSDSTLVPELLDAARQNATNANGVNNVLILLSHMKPEALRPHVREIETLAREVEPLGDRTRERSAILRKRLPRG